MRVLTGCRVVDMLSGPSLGAVLHVCAKWPELPPIFREPPERPLLTYGPSTRTAYDAALDRLMRERRSALLPQR